MYFNLTNFLNSLLILFAIFFLNSCGGFKLPSGGDARNIPISGEERARKNIEEGKGFSLNKSLKDVGRGTNFEFASSNELWRASLDVIDFMPLTSANYSGGIIITDWYSDNSNGDQSIKINIKFLANEIRADALDIDIFYKICEQNDKCTIEKRDGDLELELKKQILKQATLYKSQKEDE